MTLEYNDKLKISQRVSMLYTNYEALIDIYHNLFTLDWDDTLVIEQYDSTAKLGSQTIPNYHLDLNNMFLNGDSNPNGVKEGNVGQMYLDTETKILYVCTANGLNNWTNILTEADLTIHNYSSTAHIYSLARANGSQKQVFKTKDTNLTNTVSNNYTTHGTLTNTGSIVSGFSSSNYLEADYTFNTTSSWEVTTQIRTDQDISTLQYIEGCLDTSGSWGVLFGVENNQPKLLLSSNGASWDISSGLTGLNLSSNTSYIFKYGWSGTQYYIKRSVDEGITYTTDSTLASTSSIHSCDFYLGTGGDKTNYFLGSLDLSKFSIYVNSQKEFPQIDYINDYLMINRKYVGNKDNLTTTIKSSLVDSINAMNSILETYIDYLKNIQFNVTISSSSGNVDANGDPYTIVDLGEAFYYEDQTPSPSIDNTNNGSWSSNFGDSQNWWWWGNSGYVFGAALGSGFTAYSHHSGGDGKYNIGPQSDNRGYKGSYITHTFDTALPAGRYYFNCAASPNGYGYTLQVCLDGTWQTVDLPSGMTTTAWSKADTYGGGNLIIATTSLTAIRACSTNNTGEWGIGPIHLIRAIPNGSFENTIYFNVGGGYSNLIYHDVDDTVSEITHINSIPLIPESSSPTANRYVEQPWIQPILYSNGSLGGSTFSVEASTYEGSTTEHPAWGAFSNTSGENYEWWSSLSTSYYTIYSPTPIKITNISALLSSNFGTLNYGIESCTIEGSNNGTDWITIISLDNLEGSAGAYQNLGLETNTNYYNYYRIENIKTINGNGSGPRIKNFYITAQEKLTIEDKTYKIYLPKNSSSARLVDYSFYRQQDQPYQFNRVGNVKIDRVADSKRYYKYVYTDTPFTRPNLTGYGNYGGTGFATIQDGGNSSSWKAFDGSTSTSWDAGSSKILRFYNSDALKISKLYITNNSTWQLQAFEFYGSNDDSTWVSIGSYSGLSTGSNTVNVNSAVYYKYFKIYITQSPGYTTVAEVNMDATYLVTTITEGTSLDYDFYTEEIEGIVANNFSTRNTITPYKLLTPASKTWEIETRIKTGSDVTTGQAIIGDGSNGSKTNPLLYLISGKYRIYVSSNASAWDIANAVSGTYTVPTNSIEKIKFGWDGEKYYVKNWQSTITTEEDSGLPSSQAWKSIAYGNGKYVARAQDSMDCVYSEDGLNWTSVMTILPAVGSVCYGNNKFVAVSNYMGQGAYSEDGIDWANTQIIGSGTDWNSVCYGNGKFVAVGEYTTSGYDVVYSTDGITWTPSTLPTSQAWSSIAYGNGTYVALTYGSATGAYSSDGESWTSMTMPSALNWSSLCYGKDKFVAIASGSTNGAYSADGHTWTSMTLPSSQSWTSVAYGDGIFVAISGGSAGSTIGAYSLDGITWKEFALPSSSQWLGLCYGDGQFVATTNGTTSATLVYGEDWATDISVSSTTPIYVTTNKLALGNDLYSSTGQTPFLGSIFLNDTKITIDNQLYWDYEIGEYVWENTSVLPTTVQKHTTEWGDYSDILLGTVTAEQGMISDVMTLPYNTKYKITPNNTIPAEIVQCYKNGSTWYNLYSDGWIEIYGTVDVSTTAKDINLPIKAMKDNNYLVEACCTSGYAYITKRVVNYFTIVGTTTASCNWKVSGYIA